MKLVKARCPECGGILDIDGEKKAAICQYCKSPFIVEEAINNYVINNTVNNNTVNNITNVTNISGSNVVINQDELNRFWVIEGTTLVKYNGKQRNLKIPDNITEIATGAISGVEEVIIPSTVAHVSHYAIRAVKVIIDDNKNLKLAENSLECADVEFLGEFGQIEKNEYIKNTVHFTDNKNNVIDKFPNATVYFGNEIFKVFQDGNYEIRYIIKPDNTLAITKWDVGATRLFCKGDTIDLTSIDGRKITEFRGDAQYNLIYSLINITNSKTFVEDIYKCVKIPEGITEISGSKGNYRNNSLSAHEIYLPKTLKTLGSYALMGWDNLYIDESARIEHIDENAFLIPNDVWGSKLKYSPLELKIAPPNISDNALPFIRVNGKQIGKTRGYVIEVDSKIDMVKIYSHIGFHNSFSEMFIPENGVVSVEVPVRFRSVEATVFSDDKIKGSYIILPKPTINKITKTLFGFKNVQRNS